MPAFNPDEFERAMYADAEATWGPKSRAQANGNPRSNTVDRFKLQPFDSLTFKCQSNYLVKGLIPREGLVVVWGPPKCGKSFWTFDLTMHVALGWDYRGRRVKQQVPVVYCAFEGAAGFTNRKQAFKERHEVPDNPPFFLVGTRMDMAKEHRLLIGAIRAQIGKTMPGVVVLDTLNRSLAGSESKDEDMAAYVKAADAIRETFGCVVIIVHHCGIEGNRPRGHTSLTGAADTQLAVKKDAAGNVVVTVEYMKDGQEGDVIVSRLERVPLGFDEDDEDKDEISSCIVVPQDDAIVTDKRVKLTKNQQTLLNILSATGKAGMSNDDWFAAAQELDIATKRKADFYDARRALEEKRLIVKQYDGRWYVLVIVATPIHREKHNEQV
jgi:AAA domain